MAEDNDSRYRSQNSTSRGPAQSAPANDPLAELARLIGQSHPQSEFGGESPASPHDDRPFFRDESAAHFGSDSFAQQPNAPAYHQLPPQQQDARDYGSEPAPRYQSEPAPRYQSESERRIEGIFRQLPDSESGGARHGADPSHRPALDAARGYASERTPHYSEPTADWPGPPSLPLPPRMPQLPVDSYAPQRAAVEPQYDPQHFPDPRFHPLPDSFDLGHPGFDAQGYPLENDDRSQAGYPLGGHHDGRAMPPPHGDEFYDDASRRGGRKGVLTVAAVMALAVIGTAGAFGYRSIFGGSHSSAAPPPVIRASGEPSKVAPPPAQADQTVNKFSYDRFGDRGKDEQVVLREEKPVDPRELARSTAPRAVPPSAPAASAPPLPQAPNNAQAMANPPSALGEPRRVHTVQIRPDRPEPAISPQNVGPGSLTAASSAETLMPPQQSAPPQQLAPQSAPPPPSAVIRTPATRNANPRVAARAPQAAPAGNAPLSLSPDANNAVAAAPPAARELAPTPMRETPPPAAGPARTRVAAAPSGGGGYLVQVSSQRSQSDAQSAYQNIQSKYPSVLSGQPHMIKRADLGTRGVYYRAMIGPFGTREQAIQFCSNLKTAGGDCVVQAN